MRVSFVANNLNQSVNIIIDEKIRIEEVVEKTLFLIAKKLSQFLKNTDFIDFL